MIVCIGCGRAKPEVYLFRNEKLFSVFRDKYEVYMQADRYFRKTGYPVQSVTFGKFADLPKECDIIKNRTKTLPDGAVFFMDNLGMTVFTGNINRYDAAGLKLISFHYDTFDKNISPQTMINFYPSPNVIYNAIVRQIRSASETKDFSDVLYIYGSSHHITAQIADMLKEHYPAVRQTGCTSKGAVKTAINANKECRCIIVFGFEYNTALTETDAKTLSGKTVIEVMSDYGEAYPHISRSLIIDEPILADHALHSRELKRYLSDKDIYPNKNDADSSKDKSDKTGSGADSVTNVELNYANIIKTVSHAPKSDSITVMLENKIKENIQKKEEAKKKTDKQTK